MQPTISTSSYEYGGLADDDASGVAPPVHSSEQIVGTLKRVNEVRSIFILTTLLLTNTFSSLTL
jgi:hypothetical protein